MKTRVLLIILLISIAGGCTGGPVFSVEVFTTATTAALVSESSTAAPGSAVPASTLPAFTSAPAVLPADFSPILYGEKYDANTFFLLLGGVQAGRWLTPEQSALLVRGTSEYDIHTPALDMFQVLGYAPEFSPTRPGQFTIGSDSTRGDFGMLGVAHGWPVRQGQVEELSAENELYRQAVLNWLKEEGLSDPQLGSLQIFRVDLEGDGVDEIFMNATRLDDSQHTTRHGDYSIVLMRKVAGSQVVTMPLVADVYRSMDAGLTYPNTYLISNFMDLDQDGVLEVVVDYQRWEGAGATIFIVHGQEIKQVP